MRHSAAPRLSTMSSRALGKPPLQAPIEPLVKCKPLPHASVFELGPLVLKQGGILVVVGLVGGGDGVLDVLCHHGNDDSGDADVDAIDPKIDDEVKD